MGPVQCTHLLDKVVCFACLHEFAIHADAHSRLPALSTLSALRHNARVRAFARAQRLTVLAATARRPDLLAALTPAALPLTARSCGAIRRETGEKESTARPQSNINGVSAGGPAATYVPRDRVHLLECARRVRALRGKRLPSSGPGSARRFVDRKWRPGPVRRIPFFTGSAALKWSTCRVLRCDVEDCCRRLDSSTGRRLH